MSLSDIDVTTVLENTIEVEWHSAFLLPPGKDVSAIGFDLTKDPELAELQQRWLGFCEGKELMVTYQLSQDLSM